MNFSRLTAVLSLAGVLATPLLQAKAQTSTTTTTSSTPSGGSSTVRTSDGVAPPMTKAEMKAQKRQQKHEEKAASQSAKAAKDAANVKKHEDTATREREAAQTQ